VSNTPEYPEKESGMVERWPDFEVCVPFVDRA